MKNLHKTVLLCAAAAIPSVIGAQEISLDFESDATTPVAGVYDTWEQSPFRTGELQGNFAVLDNHLADEDTNPSAKILGIQRSRFGSNTFGVKIDLPTPLTIESDGRYYAHVMIHKPVEGRIMLIGLGKRADRDNQSNQVEQFWAYPLNDIKADEWNDAVFSIRCNAGVEIHSIVVVPHCEAPHNLTADFAAYIDEILINDSYAPRFASGDYPVNFLTDSDWGRNDRTIQAVNLNGGSDGNMSINIPRSELKGYNQRFEAPFMVKAGDNVTPRITYNGSFMHGYAYLDKDNDGEFSYGTDDDNRLDTSTDLMSYSFFRKGESGSGRNSAGTEIREGSFNTMEMPAFTIPADLTAGIYRLRYKVDWNNIDPGGNIAANNNILSNGGGVVDVLLNVHNDQVNVNQDNRNGEILMAADASAISGQKIPFGQSLEIKMNPSNGFTYNGVRVRHGYNLTGDSLVCGNPQYRDEYFYIDRFDLENNTLTIPADVIDGDVLIEGLFVEAGSDMAMKIITYDIEIDGAAAGSRTFVSLPGKDYPPFEVNTEVPDSYYAVSGVPEGKTSKENESFTVSITQNLPFQVGTDRSTAVWHNLSITAAKKYLIHTPGQNYIGLTSSQRPAADNTNAQWAFVGNVLTGFTIVNRGAGDDMILSSPTDASANTGADTWPVMTATPVPAANNTYWIPTPSANINGENGFYLHQAGFPSNRMNNRSNKLAFWTGGADAGSTFLVRTVVQSAITDISGADNPETAEYFNLQGMRVGQPGPGLYIVRRGATTGKQLIK